MTHPEPPTKQELRRAVWAALIGAGAGRFPGVERRIPNFRGAEAACRRLAELPAWRRARAVVANPDLPERAARHLALKAGKVLYVVVPRLAERRAFLRLDPARLDPRSLWRASSMRGARELGRASTPADLEPVDLVLVGAVAVAPDGARLGKGGGASDLAYALLREAQRVGPRTPVVTVAHALQVRAPGELPMEPHDLPLDAYATPDELVRCPRAHRRPRGVLPGQLDARRRAAVPLVAGR